MGPKNVLTGLLLLLVLAANAQQDTGMISFARKFFYKKDYKACIAESKRALKVIKDDILRADTWVLIGSSYDAMGDSKKAIKAFKKGRDEAPGYYSPSYNLGVTYYKLNKFKEAQRAFCSAASCDPYHPGSAYNLMLLMDKRGDRVPAMMACCRFLMLEKKGLRMEKSLMYLQQKIKGNVTVTGDNEVSITIDPGTSKQAINDFSKVDLMLSMATAMNLGKEMSGRTEAEIFVRNITALFSGLKEFSPEGKGFFWEFYSPYFVDLLNSGHAETFAYMILSYKEGAAFDVNDWMEKNKNKVNSFLVWDLSYKWNKSIAP
jgi:hypothetical protein